MKMDVPATPPGQTVGNPRTDIARGRGQKWRYILFFGATAGMAIGVLNLTAVANGWKLEDSFELMDAPITSLMDAARYRFDSAALWMAPIADVLDWAAIIFYWTLIGLFVALLICLARDRNCRRTLLCGAGGGILIGCLNLLATAGQSSWPQHYFELLDRPVNSLTLTIWEQVQEPRTFRPGARSDFPDWRLTCVVYWLVIGLVLSSLFYVVRMLVKRITATATHVAEE